MPKYRCPISGFQKISHGRHKLRVLWALRDSPLCYGDLKREAGIFTEYPLTARMLTRELQGLQRAELVLRRPLPGKVKRVEYRLSPLGRTLVPLLEQICGWSMKNLEILPPPPGACLPG